MDRYDTRYCKAFSSSFPALNTTFARPEQQCFFLKIFWKSWGESEKRKAILDAMRLFPEKEVPIDIGYSTFEEDYENGQRTERAVMRRNLSCLTALQAKRASGQPLAPDEEYALLHDSLLRQGVDQNALKQGDIPELQRDY